MTYSRMRDRNGLTHRPPFDEDPYLRSEEQRTRLGVYSNVSLPLLGDLNRMERGYLAPEVPGAGVGERFETNPAAEVAAATGLDVETVQTVLRHVFGR